jgi:uroporphyrinogen decarboxylase
VYFLKGSAPFLQHVKTVDADAYGVDWTLDLDTAAATLDKPVQGNLDPLCLFGTKEEIRRRALEVCRRGDNTRGHVFNLGHGILPPTPIENVETLVETVQSYRKGD